MNHINILETISENLKNTKLPNDLKLKQISQWTYPDGYVQKTVGGFGSQRFFVLQDTSSSIGLINFENNIKNEITINFIQGIKKKNTSLKYPKGWPEIIVSAFIKACLPILEKNPNLKIRYMPIERLKKNKQEIKTHLKKLKNEMFEAKEKIKQKNLKKSEIITLEFKILDNHLQIESINSSFVFVNSIRDRFFDKDGFLNFKKERVKKIFKPMLIKKKQQLLSTLSKLKEKKAKINKRLGKR